MPITEFVQDDGLVKALRKGVKAMKDRRSSDPLSWFYQAAIHGVTDDRIKEEAKKDPDVEKVDAKKYWNQCPHFGQSSANFLPWHRGYTYHFERVLRLHTELDDFSLPYWNYNDVSNDRRFPKVWGIQYLDGDLQNDKPDNINPLHLEERDFYFCTYQHPLTDKVPLLKLTDDAVDITLPMKTDVFFGETEQEGLGGGIADTNAGTRGLLESYPHDQIHRSVGGIIGECAGAMATPPTAGFDPVFCVHHTNIDWLWVQWACMPGKTWGKLPPQSWFDEKPWFFFDETGKEVNEPRRTYFDHRALGIRFKYEDMNCTPLSLPLVIASANEAAAFRRNAERIAASDAAIEASPLRPTIVDVEPSMKSALGSHVNRFTTMSSSEIAGSRQRIFLRFADIAAGKLTTVGYDIHVARKGTADLKRTDPGFVGSINLFVHSMAGMATPQERDVTRALANVGGSLEDLAIVLVPYPLTETVDTGVPQLRSAPLVIRGVEFRIVEY